MKESKPRQSMLGRRCIWVLAGLCAIVALALATSYALYFNYPQHRVTHSVSEAHSVYIREEGMERRSHHFEQLALFLASLRFEGQPPSKSKIIDVLGPPDMIERGGSSIAVLYFYDGTGDGAKESAVIVCDYDGKPTLGFAQRSWLNLDGWTSTSQKR